MNPPHATARRRCEDVGGGKSSLERKYCEGGHKAEAERRLGVAMMARDEPARSGKRHNA